MDRFWKLSNFVERMAKLSFIDVMFISVNVFNFKTLKFLFLETKQHWDWEIFLYFLFRRRSKILARWRGIRRGDCKNKWFLIFRKYFAIDRDIISGILVKEHSRFAWNRGSSKWMLNITLNLNRNSKMYLHQNPPRVGNHGECLDNYHC